MTPEQQVPRNALAWIILSLFLLVAPHAPRVPLWVLALFLGAAIWRILVYRGVWSFPRWPVKLGLILAAFAGVLFSFRTLIGLEPTVSLLLTAFALKLLELSKRKDAYVLIFLGYFVILTVFLFSQDLLIVLFCLFNTVVVTAALVALHRPGEDRFNGRPMRLAMVMIAQSIPLMLVLFFLFPRIGPLWTVPMKSQTARTGMSDFMKPGDVSRLSRSGEVAFRVQFDGDIPPRSEMYWRGLVFSQLRGETWSSLSYFSVPPLERRQQAPALEGEPLRYSVIMEPTQQNWVYSLRYGRSPTPGMISAGDFRLFRATPIEDDLLYQVRSWPDAVLEPELSAWRRGVELQLPDDANPRTQALGRRIADTSGNAAEIVQRVLDMYRNQPFTYTLQPPLLPETDGMDAFLFDTRRGFCEHFAGSFVMLMRAAGVPARVVAGYQGGELNPINGTVIVHQFDAHAWAEVWIEGDGWVRVDPTAAVAPTRIELGLEEAVSGEGSFLADSPLSPLRYRGISWVNMLRLRYDALTYGWQAWIVGFDSDRQFELLGDWFGGASARKFALALFGAGLLVFAPVVIGLLLQRKTIETTPWDRLYLRFCERMARMGVVRAPGEAPDDFARRASRHVPRLAQEIEEVTRLYTGLAYMPEDDPAQLQRMQQAVRSIA
jgi:transglutaminase-like putative cysteine protease